jgi:hypothetical protein
VPASRPIASAFVRIRPTFAGFAPALAKGISTDARQGGTAFGRMFGRQATTEGGRHGRVFGSVFARASAGSVRSSAGIFTGSVKALVAGFAVVKGIQVFSGFIAEGREAQKVGALTAAVLKSTGGAAKVSAKGVGDLATAISNKVGVDDEAIQSGQNLLLTFTGIRDEAGRGNKIFSRASQAIVDMTAAMNKGVVSSEGLKASSIQVGKALNDPVKGMTALRKGGVAFTEQQQKQVKAMVASGNRLGAQKVILGELNREFGGAAAASTTAGQKLGVVFGNIKERIGTAVLPFLDRFETFLTARLPGAVDVALGVLGGLGRGLKAVFDLVVKGDFTTAFRKAFHIDEDSPVIGFILRLRGLVVDLAGWITGTAVPAVGRFARAAGPELVAGIKIAADFIGTRVVPAVKELGAWFSRILPGVLSVGRTVGTWLLPSLRMLGEFLLGSVVPAVRDLGVVFAQTLLPVLRTVAPIVGGALLVGFRAIAVLLRDVLGPVLRGVTGFVREHRTAVTALAVTVGTAAAVYYTWRAATAAVTLAQTLFAKGMLLVRGAVLSAQAAVWLFNVALRANPIGIVVTALLALGAGLVYAYRHSETFRRIVDGAFRGIAAAARFMWYQVVAPALRAMLTAFLLVPGIIINAAAKAFGWVPGIGPKLKTAAEEFNKFRDKANAALGGLDDQKVTVSLGWQGLKTFRTQGGNLALAKGGKLPGYGGGDTVAAMLEPGEAVVPKHLVPEMAGWAKQRGIPGFARGGLVGFGVDTSLPNFTGLRRTIASFNRALGTAADFVARTLGNQALGGPGAMRGLAFAREQVGKPYGWGAVGPSSYDCSGLWSAIVGAVRGQNPYQRRFSTASFATGTPAGFVRGLASAIRVGVMQGSPGHMAGTIGRVNVESRGGDGVVMGPRARGAGSPLFSSRFGLQLASGGLVGDPPFDVLSHRGKAFRPGLLEWLLGDPFVADRGVRLPPGPSIVDNRTGRPEALVPAGEATRLHPKDIRALVEGIGGVVARSVGAANWSIGRTADLYGRGG